MLPIVISPDPILATVCEPCEPGDKSLKRLSKQMAHAMYKNYGCGIAAPQVGVTKRLVVIDVDWDGEKGEKNPIVLVNPEIVELAGEPEEGGEGCLSCPGISVPIARPPWARVRYFDLDGEEWEIEGDGLYGCAATDGRARALLVANHTSREMPLTVSWPQQAQVRFIGGQAYDQPVSLSPASQGLALVLPPYGCALVESGR